ncbi:hypothetical protein CR513_05229, partial [Mucuna pruriens]
MITNFGIQGQRWVRLVTLAFGGYALIWWTSMSDNIRRGIIEPRENWYNLKCMMRKRFDLHHRLQSLYLGSRSVDEFHKEMTMIMLRAHIRKREEVTIARVIHGLYKYIQDVIHLHDCSSLKELVYQVVKVEMQLNSRSFLRRSTASTSC